jgi:hypothetical protein
MNTYKEAESSNLIVSPEEDASGFSRRSFFKRAAVVGATGLVAVAGATKLAQAVSMAVPASSAMGPVATPGLQPHDVNILVAAQIAEALAVTTYTNIINTSPFFTRLPDDDQGYLVAARQEEMSHYLLEQSASNRFTPFTSFFYPPNMFADAQTTLNVLVTLEDAFIAAYLVGVMNFSTSRLRVTSARIMGIESDHRTLARVLAGDVSRTDGGPIEKITGIQGIAEPADPPNNNGYERTLCWNKIEQAVDALLPFVDADAAKSAGFDSSKSFPFVPFNPTLPIAQGEVISFTGC